MSIEQLEELADEIVKAEQLQESLKAFAWLVSNYDLAALTQSLTVSEIPELIAYVDDAIVAAVAAYVGDRGPRE